MNSTRILLAALGAFVTYMAIGGIAFTSGSLRAEFMKFPNVYRPQADMKRVMPAGMLTMFLAMVVLAVIFSMLRMDGSGVALGAKFGVLIAAFCVCSFVVHNHVNLNISLKLTVGQSIAYFIEWVAVGVVIGLIYGAPGLG